VQEDLNPHLDFLLSKVTNKINDKQLRPLILETLGVLEMNGVASAQQGEEARKRIKTKCPSYC